MHTYRSKYNFLVVRTQVQKVADIRQQLYRSGSIVALWSLKYPPWQANKAVLQAYPGELSCTTTPAAQARSRGARLVLNSIAAREQGKQYSRHHRGGVRLVDTLLELHRVAAVRDHHDRFVRLIAINRNAHNGTGACLIKPPRSHAHRAFTKHNPIQNQELARDRIGEGRRMAPFSRA